MKRLSNRIRKFYEATGQRMHIVGHSIGGIVGRGISHQIPDAVASLTALGSPNGKGEDFERSIDPFVLSLARLTVPTLRRGKDLSRKTEDLTKPLHPVIRTTYIFTKDDAVVNWEQTRDLSTSAENIEVPGTHSGLVANPHVLKHVAHILSDAHEDQVSMRNVVVFQASRSSLGPAA